MRFGIGLLFVMGAAACGGGGESPTRHGGAGGENGSGSGGPTKQGAAPVAPSPTTDTGTPPPPACPSGLPTAKALASDGDVSDVQIHGATITDAQLVYPNVWFVRGQKRVYEVVQSALEDGNGDIVGLKPQPATEIFASASDACRLAVGGQAAFCSDGKALTRRDLTGANPTA